MAFTHYLSAPGDYAAFGIAAFGPFAGATDGTIGSPGPYEPAYFVNSEFVSGNPVINWQSGDRAGAGALLLGDGTPATPSEIAFEAKIRVNTPPTYGPGGFLFQIGQNSPTPVGHLSAIYQTFALKFQWGLANANASQLIFNSTHPVYIASISGAFHKFRLECKQSTSGIYSASSGDMQLYMDDVLQIPDGFGANISGNDNGSLTHYLTLGGLENNNSMHTSFGDVLISSDSTAVPPSGNTPPTGNFNSVVQRP